MSDRFSYVRAINERYERRDALYQGAFQAKIVDQNSYLWQISRYIHLNTVHAGLVDKPEDWPDSIYREFIGLRNGTLPQPQTILEQFGASRFRTFDAYRSFVEEPQEENLPVQILLD